MLYTPITSSNKNNKTLAISLPNFHYLSIPVFLSSLSSLSDFWCSLRESIVSNSCPHSSHLISSLEDIPITVMNQWLKIFVSMPLTITKTDYESHIINHCNKENKKLHAKSLSFTYPCRSIVCLSVLQISNHFLTKIWVILKWLKMTENTWFWVWNVFKMTCPFSSLSSLISEYIGP